MGLPRDDRSGQTHYWFFIHITSIYTNGFTYSRNRFILMAVDYILDLVLLPKEVCLEANIAVPKD